MLMVTARYTFKVTVTMSRLREPSDDDMVRLKITLTITLTFRSWFLVIYLRTGTECENENSILGNEGIKKLYQDKVLSLYSWKTKNFWAPKIFSLNYVTISLNIWWKFNSIWSTIYTIFFLLVFVPHPSLILDISLLETSTNSIFFFGG